MRKERSQIWQCYTRTFSGISFKCGGDPLLYIWQYWRTLSLVTFFALFCEFFLPVKRHFLQTPIDPCLFTHSFVR